MRRILRKDLIREVKKSFARFISIAILIGMGTTFFIGLNSSAPNMLQTADAYFKAQNYQDIKVMAPAEFTLEDVRKVKGAELVNGVRLGYLAHTLTNPNGLVIELMSFRKEQFKLVEGKYPKKDGELALDNKGRKHYKIGDTVSFQLVDGKRDEGVKATTYKVVGFVESTRYIGKNTRGTASIGDGSVDLFGVLRSEEFEGEPNSLDIELVDKSRQKYLYGEPYSKDLVKAKAAVESIIEAKMAATATDIQSDLKRQEEELTLQKKDLSQQQIDLEKELTEVTDAKKESIASERQTALDGYEEAKKLLSGHQEDLRKLKDRLLISESAVIGETKRLESIGKQLAEQEAMLNQLFAENDPSQTERITELEHAYQTLLTSYERDQGSQQIEMGKLGAIREQFLTLEQVVQVEVANLPVKEILEEQFAQLERDRASGEKTLRESVDKIADSLVELRETTLDITREQDKAATLPYTVQGIDETVTFKPFRENIERLDAISKVLPFVFFFVAFIITTTLILRMIDQSREQIGTLLAMGINRRDIIKKYTFYSFSSSIVGLVLGVIAGVFGFSQVIIALYSPMYIFPSYASHIYVNYILIAVVASFISVVLIPYLVYRRLFKLPALQLIRPKEANGGKRLWIERIPGTWQKIPFFLQRTIRNIMSYKVRMGVLLIGFIGCMGLLYIGYGARNSVDQLQQRQYSEVIKYDGIVGLAEFASEEEKNDYTDYVKKIKGERLPVLQEKWESLTPNKDRVETFLISPETPKKLNQYVEFTDAQTNQELQLGINDVFVTEKLARTFNITIGDTWPIINSEGVTVKPRVTRIVKNYYLHYVYLGNQAYETLFNTSPQYNRDFLIVRDWDKKTVEKLLNFEVVSSIHTRDQDIDKTEEMTAQLNSLIGIIIMAASLLGLVVLYNLTYITILERKQEIAVIRVMGYRQKQVTGYIFREIVVLGILGIALGALFGKELHQVVMSQVELEFLFFPHIDQLLVFSEASVTLLIIATMLMFLMHHKIKQINTVEALKVKD